MHNILEMRHGHASHDTDVELQFVYFARTCHALWNTLFNFGHLQAQFKTLVVVLKTFKFYLGPDKLPPQPPRFPPGWHSSELPGFRLSLHPADWF